MDSATLTTFSGCAFGSTIQRPGRLSKVLPHAGFELVQKLSEFAWPKGPTYWLFFAPGNFRLVVAGHTSFRVGG